jgi:hypothetical protein
MPSRMHRQRNKDGRLVCDSCSPNLGPAWAAAEMSQRRIEAEASIARVMQRTAHDGGDNAILHHCPFCGSGSITGRSDGSAECDFCHSVFTVQVQPAHPNMPQTVDGQPVTPPGMPNGELTDISDPVDPAVAESEDGVAANPLNDEDPTKAPGAPGKKPNPFQKKDGPPQGGDKPGDKSKSQPPWLKNKKSYRTSTGATLQGEDYLAHLALAYADDREAVLDTVRTSNVQREAGAAEDYAAMVARFPLGSTVTIKGLGPNGSVTGKVVGVNATGTVTVDADGQTYSTNNLDSISKQAMAPGYPQGVPYECPVCHNYRNADHCDTCDDRAANEGQREGSPMDWLFHHLFPSGASS